MNVSYFMFVVFLFMLISYTEVQLSPIFPQKEVDKVCLENCDKKVVLDTMTYPAQTPLAHVRCERDINKSRGFFTHRNLFSGGIDFCDISKTRQDLWIGPDPDTFLIDTNYVQDGNIFIFGQGVFLVDNAKLTLSGHLYAQNHGQAIFRNGAYLHVNQVYLSQYPQILRDSARFEATNATVYANTVYRTLMYDNSEYVAKQTYFPYWNFRQLYDNSTLIMEDANMVGDLTINDSCQVSFLRCDTILPWFGIGDGDFVDIQFPNYNYVEHFKFDTTHPGINGIKYTVSFDTCHLVVWGIESWPGCSVTVNNSFLCATPRIFGPDTAYFSNITNYTFYPFLAVPIDDRFFQIVNSYIQLWCIYTYDNSVLFMDSCCWGESHAKDSSRIYATQCTATGFPSSVTSVHEGFYSFTDGQCNTFVSSWDRGTVFLINAYVAPSNPSTAQVTNLAHNHSYLLAVNSYFEYEPEARDTALVMVAAIDSTDFGIIDTIINVYGSAWIDVGPFNPITFDKYKLYGASKEDSIWTLVEESTSQVHIDLIATWNTSGLSKGEYILKLIVWDDAGDSLTAFRDITLQSLGMEEKSDSKITYLFQNYPNPFSTRTTIDIRLQTTDQNKRSSVSGLRSSVCIYDVAGRLIRTLSLNLCNPNKSVQSVSWDGTDNSNNRVESGIYFFRIEVDDFKAVKKLILLH